MITDNPVHNRYANMKFPRAPYREYPKYVRIEGVKGDFVAASPEEEQAILAKHAGGKKTLKLGDGEKEK